MKTKIRATVITLILTLCLSLCTIQAFATNEDGENPVATEAPVVTQPPVVTEAPTQAPVVTEAPTQAVATQAPTKSNITSSPKTSSKTYSSRTSSKSSKSSYVYKAPAATSAQSGGSSYSSQSGNSNQSPNANAPLYDVDEEPIDDDTLKKRDWAGIAEQLQNAENDDEGDDADNFDFIQKNNSSFDNGGWILIAGIALEVIAVGIIVTLIILAVRRKKKLKNKRVDSPQRSSNSRSGTAQRAQGGNQKRQVKKRSKYDTADVYLPRGGSGGSRGGTRGSSGKHYKPKH